MTRLSAREASIFTCLADTLLAPAPPLPPVADTDAIAAFEALLDSAPPANAVALRGALLALELAPRLTGRHTRWRRLAPAERLAFVSRLERLPVRGVRQLLEAVRGTAALAYYGDPGVQRVLGYDPRPGPAA